MNPPPPRDDMGEIVQTVARWLKGFILIYGMYVVLYGHLSPGGGFEGGVIIACGFILPSLAGGRVFRQTYFAPSTAAVLATAGVVLFLGLAAFGMAHVNGAFLQDFIPTSQTARFTLFSGGIIPIANIAIALLVASALFLIFRVLTAFSVEPETGGTNDARERKEP